MIYNELQPTIELKEGLAIEDWGSRNQGRVRHCFLASCMPYFFLLGGWFTKKREDEQQLHRHEDEGEMGEMRGRSFSDRRGLWVAMPPGQDVLLLWRTKAKGYLGFHRPANQQIDQPNKYIYIYIKGRTRECSAGQGT